MSDGHSCCVCPSMYQPNPIGLRRPTVSSQVYPVGKCERKYSTATKATGALSQSGTPTRSSRRISHMVGTRKIAQQTERKSHDAYMAGWATRIHEIAAT